MTILSKGDSVLVCKINRITLQEYHDFLNDKAVPRRTTWIRIREAYMESLINGESWIVKRAASSTFTSYIFWSKTKWNEQKDSTIHYKEEKKPFREIELDKEYPNFSKPNEKEFKNGKILIDHYSLSQRILESGFYHITENTSKTHM